jgi:hypothetical protein
MTKKKLFSHTYPFIQNDVKLFRKLHIHTNLISEENVCSYLFTSANNIWSNLLHVALFINIHNLIAVYVFKQWYESEYTVK